jgi:hypothetical protein
MPTAWRPLALSALLLVGVTATGHAQRALEGQVLSLADSAPLPQVRVAMVGRPALRAETDTAGYFVLTDAPTGAFQLIVDRLGIVTDTVDIAAGVSSVTLYVAIRVQQLAPLVAVARPVARERFEELAQTSTLSLDKEDIDAAPAVGEADVTRAVQLLPGVVAKNDYTSALNVRGGESDQNLIRLNNVTVFNPFHLGGMFSTFDAAAVSGVELLTGAFPAQYGGRLSSVLDVRLRTGRPDRIGATAGVSVLSSKVLLEGPIGGTGATVLVGARRTYADAFVKAVEDDPFTYYFADLVASVSVPLPGGGSALLTGYWGRDVLRFPFLDPEPGRDGIDFGFDWGNRLGGLTIVQPLSDAVALTQTFGLSGFSAGLDLAPDVLNVDNDVRHFASQTDLGITAGAHEVHLGAAFESNRITYGVDSRALEQDLLSLGYRPSVLAGYVDYAWRPASWLILRPGLRVEHVGGGAAFTGVSPRASAKVFLSENVAFTGSVGRFYQPINSIRDQELPVTIFDFWIGADDVTPVASSDQGVVGVEAWLSDTWSMTVEGYTKSFRDLPVPDPNDDPKVRGDEFVPARGYAWGVDVLIRRHAGAVNGWIAYGYGKALRRSRIGTFAPAHDRRHTLDIVVQTPGPLGSRMSARWGYGSPLPYTGVIGSWVHRDYNVEDHTFEDFDTESIGSTINAQRYPHYSRLDVSFRWSFRMLGGRWQPYLNVLNVYNRRNVFFYTFDYEDVPATRGGYSQLPVLPTLGVEIAW